MESPLPAERKIFPPASRRAFLAGATGALAAALSARLARAEPAAPTVPESRGGADRLGTTLSPDAFGRWVNAADNRPPAAGSVTLYRWWTDTCPFCEATLPAVEALRREFGPRGLNVVAVYHPKPPREVADEVIAKAAARIGYAGPVAVDGDWAVLKKLWLSTGRRPATSVSFLTDRRGAVRFVHPGPAFYPSDHAEDARENADYLALRQAIAALLAEPANGPTAPAPAPAGGR